MGIYEGSWHCDIHDEDYTSEGICPACYDEMQCGDKLSSDEYLDKHCLAEFPDD